jgi:hypothetical protein
MPSSAVQDFDYDPERRELTVTFVTGRVYCYGKVPEEIYDAFVASGSKGRFFNKYIRGSYPYRELAPV